MLVTLPNLLRQNGKHLLASKIEQDAHHRAIVLGIGGDKFAVDIDGRVRAMSKEEATDWLDLMENTNG